MPARCAAPRPQGPRRAGSERGRRREEPAGPVREPSSARDKARGARSCRRPAPRAPRRGRCLPPSSAAPLPPRSPASAPPPPSTPGSGGSANGKGGARTPLPPPPPPEHAPAATQRTRLASSARRLPRPRRCRSPSSPSMARPDRRLGLGSASDRRCCGNAATARPANNRRSHWPGGGGHSPGRAAGREGGRQGGRPAGREGGLGPPHRPAPPALPRPPHRAPAAVRRRDPKPRARPMSPALRLRPWLNLPKGAPGLSISLQKLGGF